MNRRLLLGLFLSAAFLCGPACAEDDKDDDLWVQNAVGGLSGFGEFISTDALPALTFRAAVAFQYQQMQISERNASGLPALPGFPSSLPTVRLEDRAHVFNISAALGLFAGLEVAAMAPVINSEQIRLTSSTPSGLPEIEDDEFGLGNVEIALKWKLPIDLGPIALTPYAKVIAPTGEQDLLRPRRLILEGNARKRTGGTITQTLRSRGGGEGEAGLAVGAHFGIFSIQGSIAGRDIEGSTPDQTFKYRLGVTLTPLDVIAAWVYADGEEWEGKTRSNLFVGAGVTIYVKPLVLSLGVEHLLVDDAYDDLTTVDSGDEVRFSAVTLTVGVVF